MTPWSMESAEGWPPKLTGTACECGSDEWIGRADTPLRAERRADIWGGGGWGGGGGVEGVRVVGGNPHRGRGGGGG